MTPDQILALLAEIADLRIARDQVIVQLRAAQARLAEYETEAKSVKASRSK